MTLVIICAFIGCWTPYFVVHLIHIWSEYRYVIADSVYAFAETLALLNSAINPVLYGCFNVQLKRSLAELCCPSTAGPVSSQRAIVTSPSRNCHASRNGREMIRLSSVSDVHGRRSRSVVPTRTNSYPRHLVAISRSRSERRPAAPARRDDPSRGGSHWSINSPVPEPRPSFLWVGLDDGPWQTQAER